MTISQLFEKVLSKLPRELLPSFRQFQDSIRPSDFNLEGEYRGQKGGHLYYVLAERLQALVVDKQQATRILAVLRESSEEAFGVKLGKPVALAGKISAEREGTMQ